MVVGLLVIALTLGFCGRLPAADSPASDGPLLLAVPDATVDGELLNRGAGGNGLNLRIESPQAVRVSAESLQFVSSAIVATSNPATALTAAIRESEALTVAVWVNPLQGVQSGPARILTLSIDTSRRNFTLAQDGDRYDFRLRTTETNENGIPSTATPAGSVVAGEWTHVVVTRGDDGETVIYLNGAAAIRGRVGGTFANWDDNCRLALGNELTGDRTWLGEISLAAIYSRALSADEVSQLFAAGRPHEVDETRLPPSAATPVDFLTDVQPILKAHCLECHGTGNEEGGLNLGVRSRVLEGGSHGPVFVDGESARSRLIHLVSGVREGSVMPPEGDRLTAEEVGVLRRWIDDGADWPAGADIADPRLERAREHWAFQPLLPVEVPHEAETAGLSAIDGFVRKELATRGLSPSPPAAPRVLIRRMAFDITGLPPTPDEIDTFVTEYERDVDSAVAALVDRLLASRQFGERWARHWLDIARYADSGGQEGDQDRPTAYHYRDFVIRALNDDLPYDTFVRWQLAGDEIEPDNLAAISATGFLTNGPNTVLEDKYLEEERLRNRYNELDDMVATTGSAFLALTVGCARCHDHKYDAISARDYYRLLSAVHSGDRQELPIGAEGVTVLAFQDYEGSPRPTWLFERADFYDRDQPVRLGFPEVLLRGKTSDDYWSAARAATSRTNTTAQRRALADWMTDVEHGAGPLLARVIVNRIWQHYFGHGLARTVSDFGVRGESPTHPELLDWLARDLVDHGWSLKRLHSQILLSQSYRQSSEFDDDRAALDPENRLLWRMTPRRLEAEALRDAMLAVSGTLNPEAYGPGFKPPIADEALTARNLKSPYPDDADDGPATRRRTVYMFHKRLVPYPLLQAFDRPDLMQSCGQRDQTTVAPQSLALLNDQFVRLRANDFATRLVSDCGDDDERLVDQAFRTSLGRPPSEPELATSIAFIVSQTDSREPQTNDVSAARHAAVADFCQTLFSLNEFLYVD
jgi:mono/diheme cytochrome c family protein